jgi:hypothetical protein
MKRVPKLTNVHQRVLIGLMISDVRQNRQITEKEFTNLAPKIFDKISEIDNIEELALAMVLFSLVYREFPKSLSQKYVDDFRL